MRALLQIFFLAYADYRYERLLSLCSILGLAAVLTPLLILYGVKFGVVHTLTERMSSTPYMLEIVPAGSGRYTSENLERLRQHPSVAFVLPRTRSISATMQLSTLTTEGQKSVTTVSLEPTSSGDPLLKHYGCGVPILLPISHKNDETSKKTGSALRESGVILTEPAARRLGIGLNNLILGRVERSYAGKNSDARIQLRVIGILPPSAAQKEIAFVPLALLEATEDFRDGRAVPDLGIENGWGGEPRPDVTRLYPSFRLYARTLADVTKLKNLLFQQGIDTYTHAAEIEQMSALEKGLDLIFSLICTASALGFFASTSSSVLAGIKRKERTLGMLQLNGFSRATIMCFPLVQVCLTACAGTILAGGIYFCLAQVINYLFADSLVGLERICQLLPEHFLLALSTSVGLSLLAATGPALRSTKIEPSEVIRDV